MHVNRCCKSRRKKFDIESSRENFNTYRPLMEMHRMRSVGESRLLWGDYFELVLNIGKSRKTFQN
jgi:hypothetical protein